MTVRAAVLSLAIIATGLAIWSLTSESGANRASTAVGAAGLKMADENAMQLVIDHVDGSESVVQVSVRNTDPSKTLTVLRWDTPLDRSAFRTGALTLLDSDTGEEIPGLGLKLNRMLPPPSEDLIEIPPQSTASQEFTLSEPWMPKGRAVKIQGSGRWKAVWPRSKDAISNEEQRTLAGSDVFAGEFHVSSEKSFRVES